MDPTVIAAITAALTALATEVAKGAAGQAGKDAWGKIKQLLGAKPQAALDQAQAAVAERLESDPEIVRELLDLLKASQSAHVGELVGSIDAEKVIVAGTISGDIQM